MDEQLMIDCVCISLDSVKIDHWFIKIGLDQDHFWGYGCVFLIETRQSALKLLYWCQNLPLYLVQRAAQRLLMRNRFNYSLNSQELQQLLDKMEYFDEMKNVKYLLLQPELILER